MRQVGIRLGVAADWRGIKTDWRQLKSDEARLSADDAVARHDALIARIVKLSDLVIGRSALNVDPSPPTAALIQIAARDVPGALIASGNVQWYATRASIKGYLGGDDQMALSLYHDEVVADFAAATRDLNGAPATARAKIAPALAAAQGAFDSSYGVVQAQIINAQKMTITTAELFADSRAISSSLQSLSDLGYSTMAAAVKQRLSQVTTWRNVTAGVGAIALGVALALSWLITRALAAPLAQAIEVFGCIAAGKYDNTIDLTGSDEAGHVLRSLDDMQQKLRTQIENERLVAAENARIRQALDKVSTSVVLADGQQRIIYLNDTASAAFARMQHEIRRSLPAFDVPRLRGASLETLSADAAGERHELDTLAGSRVAERQLGACTFRTVTNPVLDERGARIGTVMEWTDRTQEVAVEKEMQGMLSAVVAGDLGSRIELGGKTGFFEAMSRGVNQLADNMAELVSRVKARRSRSAPRRRRDLRRQFQPVAAHGGAVLLARGDRLLDGGDDHHGQAERRQRRPGQPARPRGARSGREGRRGGEPGGRGHGRHQRGVEEDRRHHRRHRRHRLPDQPAGAQRRGRGGARRRAGPRLRGRGERGAQPRRRCATAAKEIKELIQDSVRKVEDGSVLVTQSGQTLEKIVASVKKVTDIVAEIAAASREQSSGIEQVNRAVMQMDELTQQNAALVEEATAASQAMVEQVRGLNEMLARFQVGVAELAAPAFAPTSQVSRAAEAAARSRMERRGTNRPWAARGGAAKAVQRKPTVEPARTAVVARGNGNVGTGDGGDSEWQEF